MVDDTRLELMDVPVDAELDASMVGIERREWWLWTSAVSVTLLLTAGIASFLFPSVLSQSNPFDLFSLQEVVRGLVALVLLLDLYVVYEQLQIQRLRRELTEQVYKLSVLDSLTGLFNRRHLEQRLVEEIARCERHGCSLAVILFDLNSFKQVNDTHGHGVGDSVLQAFAERLKKATRGSDVAGRFGVDEFLVVLPECKADGVQYVLDRLSKFEVEADGRVHLVSFSAGWTNYIVGESPREFLKRADAALYAHKRGLHG